MMRQRAVWWVVCALAAAAYGCTGEPTAPVMEELQPVAEPKPELPLEEPPSLLAYATPAVEEAQVNRQGRKVRIRLRWSAVEGAAAYEVQMSRVLTFSKLVVDAKPKRPRHVAKRMQPAVYFWRVRAVGDAGEGAFSNVQVLDATISGMRKSRARRRLARQRAEEEETMGGTEIAAPKAPAPGKPPPPLRVVWRRPEHRAVVARSPLKLEGVATRGTQISIGGAAPVEVDSLFSLEAPLIHGRNDLVLTAVLGDQSKTLRRSVFYADPKKLTPIRERFESLKTQLEEIGAIRDELADTVRSLEKRIAKAEKAQPADVVAELKGEMQRITQIRREIDKEVNRAISELDKLLGS